MAELSEMIGVERVLFGSDYPHPEGLADPITYVDELKNMTEEHKALIMGGNMARLLNV
jgi:predicted TIM-barrel fold metal-dependent hydrolase